MYICNLININTFIFHVKKTVWRVSGYFDRVVVENINLDQKKMYTPQYVLTAQYSTYNP